MKTPSNSRASALWGRGLRQTGLLALAVACGLVSAATTDIANSPVAASRTATVKSNIMVLMDTSNSMAWTHMPDEMEGTSLIPPDKLSVGYKSAQCNALYYDPNRTYKRPVDSTGSNLAAATFTAARYNYYSNDTTTVDLSSAFRAYDRNTRRKTSPSGGAGANEDPAQQAYYYKYTGTDTLDTSSTSPCMAADILTPGSSGTISTANGTWQRVLVSSTSGPGATDERQNFANWYQYYRTRLALVKSGIGLAFSTVSDAYRVGLITMNPGTPVSSSYYEQLGDFNTAKRSSWYSKLYSQTAQNSSPAREALARVGRHYASKTDGINQGMPDPNPSNYSCQQNFTIMTTDGYWNTAAETVGPVGLDGSTWVGQQDGTLTTASGNSPRPIWDGGTGGSKVTTDISNLYSYATCSTGLFNKTLSKTAARTTVVNRTISQTFEAKFQRLKTELETRRTATQVMRSTEQVFQSQTRVSKSTNQWNDNTIQRLRTDTYTTGTGYQTTKSTYQTSKTTTQTTRTTERTNKNTYIRQATLYKTSKVTTQTTRATEQRVQSKYIRQATKYQTSRTRTTISQSTSQTSKKTTQVRQTSTQVFQYDGTTEQTTAVASCTPGGNISCATETIGPNLVASCTAQTASSSNNYLTITCASTVVGPTPVDPTTCTAAAPSSSNNYTLTECPITTTGPTVVNPSTCTASVAASSSNSWTATTCTTSNDGPTVVDVSTAGCPSGTNTTAAGTWTTAAASGNGWTRTVCTTAITQNATNVDPATCTATIAATSANSWTTTTCTDNNTLNTGVDPSTCPVGTTAASSTNNWIRTVCADNNATAAAVDPSTVTSSTVCGSSASSTTAGTWVTNASSSNSWVKTTCVTSVNTTAAVDVPNASCPSGTNAYAAGSWTTAAASGNSWTKTVCTTAVSTAAANVDPTTCTANAAGTSANGWTNKTCSDNNTLNVAVDPTTCTVADTPATSPNWIRTTCVPSNTGPTGINPTTVGTQCPSGTSATTSGSWVTAASSSNSWTRLTCATTITNATAVDVPNASCPSGTSATTVGTWTTAAATGNNWLKTVCTTNRTSGPTAVDPAACSNIAATAANSWTTTVCTYAISSPATNVQTCTPQAPSAANGWTEIVCNNYTVGPYAVASCTSASGAAGNQWVTTNCPTPVTTGPTPVATCGAVAPTNANNYVEHFCTQNSTGPTFVDTCTTATANSGNTFTSTSCSTETIQASTAVQSCTPVTPDASTNWIRTTCTPNNTGPTAIDINTVGSVCPAGTSVTATGTFVRAAASGNSWVKLTCTVSVTGPTLVNRYDTSSCPVGTSTTVGTTITNTSYGTSPNWLKTDCVTTVKTATTPVDPTSCTVDLVATNANGWVETDCSDNNVASHPVDPTTCTVANTPASSSNNWIRTTCSTTESGPTAVDPGTCTANISPSSSNDWKTTTCNTVVSPLTPVPSCNAAVAGSGNDWVATACFPTVVGPDQVSSCTPVAPTAGNDYQTTSCAPVAGVKLQYTPTRTVTTDVLSGGLVVGTSQTQVVGSAADANGVCLVASTAPDLPSPNPKRPSASELPAPDVSGCTAWPCVQTYTNVAGGSKNSLADVAQYYYVTDLRPDLADNVSRLGQGPEDDRLTSQHMTTFVMGLGVSGTLAYDKNYKSSATGAIANIRNGTSNWPVWPSPDTNLFPQASNGNYNDQLLYNDKRSIDDFWHTAINGRGQYFSAADPDSVIEGIRNALSAIGALSGAATAATTSTLTPVEGDNSSFVAGFTTEKWIGDLAAYEIDINTGDYSADPRWTASAKLSTQVGQACDKRNIYVGGTGTLSSFSWNTYACDDAGAPTGTASTGLSSAQQAYFNATVIQGLSQYSPTNTDGNTGSVTQTANAPGANLVNFVRGQRQYEGFVPANTKLYRSRETVLGDIVNSQPTYVPAPSYSYSDDGYSTYKSDNSGRIPMIYVGANDGMLHAFYAPKPGDTSNASLAGKEAWAVIPSAVLPNLYKLADYQYSDRHTWYVDSTPVVGDVYDTASSSWKTILVGGLGGGGKAYYALQLNHTAASPGAAPTGLWEFKQSDTCFDPTSTAAQYTDCHLGYTFGRPVITKYVDPNSTTGASKWVVLLTSGYNNVRSPAGTGDGVGYLYVLDAMTGRILHKISTGAGSATSPSGLREINTYVTNALANNQTLRVYGADVLGNVWRFDINDNLDPAGREAVKLGQALDADGNPQPITTRPMITEYTGKTVVVVGTGRLLGLTDLTSTQTQSIYAIPDALGSTTQYTNFRTSLKPMAFTQATTSTGQKYRTIACTGSDTQCATPLGWYVDLDDSGERVNVDMLVIQGTLILASNVPQSSECNVGGYSWITQLDVLTGTSIDTVASVFKASGIAGLGAFTVTSGTKLSVTTTSGTVFNEPPKFKTPPPAGKRISWREIVR